MALTAQQLKIKARAYSNTHHVSVMEVLQNYMFERILFRISRSPFADKIILKGGLLVSSIFGLHSRTTMDMDVNFRNIPADPDYLLEILRNILEVDGSDDLEFDILGHQSIRKEDPYEGTRIKILAKLENLRIPLSLDFSTGDIITPQPIIYTYPQLFDSASLKIVAYPIESVIAEKLHAILDHHGAKGRMKDYYDLYHFITKYKDVISQSTLKKAVTNTFRCRNALHLLDPSTNGLEHLASSKILQKRWDQFSLRHAYARDLLFTDMVGSIACLFMMITEPPSENQDS